LNVEHFTVFRGQPGQGYSHQQQLISHQGKLYATWSLGIKDEEGPGERMVLAVSADQGATWSEPITVAPSRKGEFGDSIVVSSGMRINEDGTFMAFYGEWDRAASALNPDGTRTSASKDGALLRSRTEARISSDEGRTWSEPVLTIARVINYMPPAPTRSGRLIFPGNLTYHYTDDKGGLTGWKRAAVPGIPEDYVDDYFSMHTGQKLIGLSSLFTEASFHQTDDGVIHMMLRNENGDTLGVSESADDGETWSMPRLTAFTDTVCRAHFGRLADGRFFAMSCPRPRSESKDHHRTPMVLAVSKDGITFDRHFILGDEPGIPIRMPGMFKGGRYGYPYLHVVRDTGYVIYSINKEDITIGRFRMGDISPE
jgi:hypothetical protein